MTDAYDEGRSAYFADRGTGSNPYPEPSNERELWFCGYHDARTDSEMDRDLYDDPHGWGDE